MKQQIFAQEDFFMYIPALDDMKPSTHMPHMEGTQTQFVEMDSHSLNSEDWVKIPVADSLVVYAHKWNEQ